MICEIFMILRHFLTFFKVFLTNQSIDFDYISLKSTMKNYQGDYGIFFLQFKTLLKKNPFLSQHMGSRYVFTFANDRKFCFVIFFTHPEEGGYFEYHF